MKEQVYLWCQQAIELINQQTSFSVDTKAAADDLVTDVDRLLESKFKQWISEAYPDHQMVGEEYGLLGESSDHLWIIDPIDGTVNFVKQGKDFGILISYYYQRKPVLAAIVDVTRRDIFMAIVGEGVFKNKKPLKPLQNFSLKESLVSIDTGFASHYPMFQKINEVSFKTRYIGACSMDSLAVIEGRFGVYISYRGKLWDYAAPYVFAKVMNLGIFSVDGKEFDPFTAEDMILCNPGATQDLKELLYE